MTVARSQGCVGNIYILTNPALPGMIKIGYTEKPDPEMRARELSQPTAIPLPFALHASWLVEYPSNLEARIHTRLAFCRVSKDREFFRIEPDDAEKLINTVIHGTEDLSEVLRLEAQSLVRLYRKYPDLFKEADSVVSQIEQALGVL